MRKLIPILETMLQFIPAFPLSALNIFSNTFRLEVLLSLLSLIISLSLPTKYTRHVRWRIFYIPEAAPYQLLSLAFVVFLNQIKSFPPSLKNLQKTFWPLFHTLLHAYSTPLILPSTPSSLFAPSCISWRFVSLFEPLVYIRNLLYSLAFDTETHFAFPFVSHHTSPLSLTHPWKFLPLTQKLLNSILLFCSLLCPYTARTFLLA